MLPAVRVLKAGLQAVALAAAAWVLVRMAQPNWGALRAVRVTIDWGTLALASIVWLASFLFLVWLWTKSLAWWQSRLEWRPGLRMFVLTNLARYIPGAIWQFTGLALFAVEQGVSPFAVAGAVLLQQLVLLATGLVLALAFAPALVSPLAATLPLWATLALGAAGMAALLWLFPIALPALQRRLEAALHRDLPLPRPPGASFARYLFGCVLGWVGYGVAFWLFGRALFDGAAPSTLVAAPAFIASYVAGIIAVFAPSGLVVREAALVAALASHIGTERAFLLAVSARLWAIALEIVLALAVTPQGFRSTNTN
jgi:glycosyltransferase 2 family protein